MVFLFGKKEEHMIENGELESRMVTEHILILLEKLGRVMKGWS